MSSFGEAPLWWTERGVIVPGKPADDYAAINQGQLKKIAASAVAEMNEKLQGGAGSELNTLVASWSTNTVNADDFAVTTIGQVKGIAKLIYQRLYAANVAAVLPVWLNNQEPSDDDFALANIGQVKNLFEIHIPDQHGERFSWASVDVGRVGEDSPGTSVSSSASEHVISSSGTGFGATGDKVRFISRDTAGNVEVEARIKTLTGPATAESGIMIRQSEATNSAFAFVGISQDRELRYRWRSASGAVSAMSLGRYVSTGEQVWLRLMKSANSLAAYFSTDGIHWEVVGASTVTLTDIFKAGLVVTAGASSPAAESDFDHALVIENVPQRYSKNSSGPASSTLVPVLWLRSDWNLNTDANGRIVKWEDFSGYANDAVATATSRPLLATDALGLKPVARFESTSLLANRKFLTIPHPVSLYPESISIFVVAKWDAAQAQQAGLVSRGGSSAGYTLGFNNGQGRFLVPNSSPVLFGPAPTSGAHLLAGFFSKINRNKGLSMFLDGKSSPLPYIQRTSGITFSASTPFFVGQYLTVPNASNPTESQVFPFIGDIAEILVFDRGVSEGERLQIEAYFRAKYPLTPPIEKLLKPFIYLAEKIYSEPQTVTLGPSSATRFYQINDGPVQVYTTSAPIVLGPGKQTIKAWAVLPGYDNSDVTTATIVVDQDSKHVAKKGLQLWLRADTGVKIENNEVTQWQSQWWPDPDPNQQSQLFQTSGLAAIASGGKPVLLPTDAGINSKPAVTFSADRLSVAVSDNPSLFEPNLTLSGHHTVVIIARASAATPATTSGATSAIVSRRITSPQASGYAFAIKAFSTTTPASLQFQSLRQPAAAPYLEGALSPLISGVKTNQWGIFQSIFGEEFHKAQINGGAATSISATSSVGYANTPLLIGGHAGTSNSFYGDIAEILIYDRELAAAELRSLRAYLQLRYNIADTQIAPEVDLQLEPKPGIYSVAPTVTCSSPDGSGLAVTYTVNNGSAKTSRTIDLSTESAETLPTGMKRYEVKVSASLNGFSSVVDRSFVYYVENTSKDLPRDKLRLWLRGDVGITTSSSNFVSRWSDQSGKGNDVVTSSVSTSLPQKIENSINNQPAITFGSLGGISQMVEAQPIGQWPGLGSIPNNDVTVIAIVRNHNSADNAVIVEQETADDLAGFSMRLRSVSSNRVAESRFNGSTIRAKSGTADFGLPTGFNMIVQRASWTEGTDHFIGVNRYASNTASGYDWDTNSNARLFSLGARRRAQVQTTSVSTSLPVNGLQGDIAELLVFDTALTDAELASIESYMVQRYALDATSRPLAGSRMSLPTVGVPQLTPSGGTWPSGTLLSVSHRSEEEVSLSYRFAAGASPPTGAWSNYVNSFDPGGNGVYTIQVRAQRAGYAEEVATFKVTFVANLPNIPRDDMIVWLAADHIATSDTHPTNGGALAWRDLSGRGNDALAMDTNLGPNLINSPETKYRASSLPAKALQFPAGESRRLAIRNSADLLSSTKTVILVSRSATEKYRVMLQQTAIGENGIAGGWQLIQNGMHGKVGIGPLSPFKNPPETVGISTTQPQIITGFVGKGVRVLGPTVAQSPGSSWIYGDAGRDLIIGGSIPFRFTGTILNGVDEIINITTSAMNRLAEGMMMVGGNGQLTKESITDIRYSNGTKPNRIVTSKGVLSSSIPAYEDDDLNASSYMGGEISELLIYSKELNENELREVHQYLLNKYLINDLPLSAPVITVAPIGQSNVSSSPSNTIGGVYKAPSKVTITPPEPGATVHYQQNGGAVLTSTIAVNINVDSGTDRFSAWATKTGYTQSPTAHAQVTIEVEADLISKDQLLLWVRSDSTITDSSSNVTNWLDVSGNAHHLTKPAGTATKHPKLVASPVGDPFQGHPAIKFSATDKSCLEGNYAALDSGNVSIFTVFRRPIGTATFTVIGEKWSSSPSKGYGLQFIQPGAGPQLRFASDAAITNLNHTITEANAVALAGGTHGSTVRRLYYRGNVATTHTPSPPIPITPSNTPFYVGGRLATNNFDGEIAEMWVWGREISEAEINQLSVYANKKYGMSANKQVPVPVANYEGGTYSAAMSVKVSSPMVGTTLHYEIGTDPAIPVPNPTVNSPSAQADDIAGTTFNVNQPYFVIKIMATRPGFTSSEIKEWTYRVEPDKNIVRQGLVAWFRGDRGVITAPENANVERWMDQTGMANDATPPVTSNLRATYMTGSIPAIRFNPAGNTKAISLQVPHSSIRFPGSDTSFKTMSAIAVVRKLGNNAGGLIVRKGNYQMRFGGGSSAPTAVMQINTPTITVPIRQSTFEVLSGSYDGVVSRLSNSESVTAPGSVSGDITENSDPIYLGTSLSNDNVANLQGEIAELLIYNRGLSASESLQMERYLQKEYGIFTPSQNTVGKPTFFPFIYESTLTLAAPQKVSLRASPGLEIYYTTDPILATTPSHTTWTRYTQAIHVDYTTKITAFCRRPGAIPLNGPSTWAIFGLDPLKYPAPANDSNDLTPPTITLEKPTNATLISNP